MKTIAFYSYKGGVGRSLTLANFARLLARYLRKKVFAVDLDLEAPGLHYKFLSDAQRERVRGGVVDYLSSGVLGGGPPKGIEQYVLPVEHEPGQSGLVHLLPAGRVPTSDYWRQLSQLRWHELLYDPGAPGIPLFLEMKEEIREIYTPDYLLIDARTGVTEVGGVATTLLADVVVALLVNNRENIEGLRAVLRSIGRSPRIEGAPPVEIVPVLTRIPRELPWTDSAAAAEYALLDKVRGILCEPAEDLAQTLTVERIFVLHSEPRLQVEERILVGDPPGQSESGLREDYLLLFEGVAPELAQEPGFDALKEAAHEEKVDQLAQEAVDTEGQTLVAAQKAVELHRELVKARPEALPGLANSLISLGTHLRSVGRPQEALTAVEEAAKHYRALMPQRRGEVLPELARSLAYLGTVLGEAGRLEEALAPTEEAVEIGRALARQDPHAFQPVLASSLHNLAIRLRELGRRDEALAPAQEATELYRVLARQNPDAFQPTLGVALNNLGLHLSALGRHAEALASVQDAVELCRALAGQNADAFQPDLATSLNNLANRLSNVGRRDEALAPAQESVDLYRALARQNPDAFQADLARSLGALSRALSGMERYGEAAAAMQEGIVSLRDQFTRLPEAFAALMGALVRDYLEATRIAGTEPDTVLLAPTIEVLDRLERGEAKST